MNIATILGRKQAQKWITFQ